MRCKYPLMMGCYRESHRSIHFHIFELRRLVAIRTHTANRALTIRRVEDEAQLGKAQVTLRLYLRVVVVAPQRVDELDTPEIWQLARKEFGEHDADLRHV